MVASGTVRNMHDEPVQREVRLLSQAGRIAQSAKMEERVLPPNHTAALSKSKLEHESAKVR